VSGYLSGRTLFVTESARYGDPETGRFFMRTVFRGPANAAALAEPKNAFAAIGLDEGPIIEQAVERIATTPRRPRISSPSAATSRMRCCGAPNHS
jgi:formyltetrahydrofolate hydrolase